MKKIMLVVVVILILVVAVFSAISLIPGSGKEESASTTQNASESIVPSIPEIEPVANPFENEIPDASPTENTNPFSDTYINPFK